MRDERELPGEGYLPEDLDRLVPGVGLAAVLEKLTGMEPPSGAAGAGGADDTVTLDALADEELGDVVAGWERVASWVRAAQARAAAELVARTDDVLSRDSAAGEIAACLHVTTGEAWQIAMRGEGCGVYPALSDALAAGRIDAKKVDTFLRAGSDLTPVERGEAIVDLLPLAPRRTWRWISEQMNARAATLHGAKARRRDVTDRCNVWAEQAGAGRGRIVADLPVADAAVTFNAVQAAAGALKGTPGETRSLGALRAAAFTALVTGRIVLPCTDDDDSDTTDDPDGSEPAWLVEPVLDTDLIPLPDDPDGVALTGPASVPGSAFPSPAVEGARLRVVEVPATVNVTVPATMLLDPQDATPGMLEGIGPIPADEAARLATGGTWRRLLTDPVTGVLTDYSTRSYRPGAVLRAAVAARDQACTFPGCDRPARSGGKARADLDHIEAFDPDHRYRAGEPGQTRAANLHPLCRRHHNLKTHAKWQVTRDPETGTTRWTAPTGTVTGIAPTVVDPTIRYGLARGLTLAAPPDRPAASSGTEPPASGLPPF